jgi:hypothetical protein
VQLKVPAGDASAAQVTPVVVETVAGVEVSVVVAVAVGLDEVSEAVIVAFPLFLDAMIVAVYVPSPLFVTAPML